MNIEQLTYNFYSTKRTNPLQILTDGGGPFGFDVHFAIEIDSVLELYACDTYIETGCCVGDTIEYISKMYPNLKILTCEKNPLFTSHAKTRLRGKKNVEIRNQLSVKFLNSIKNSLNLPFYYLDAHSPKDNDPILLQELKLIDKGIVCIGDFYIGENWSRIDNYDLKVPYGYDIFGDIILDKNLILECCEPSTKIYTNNPLANYPLPSHQFVRKSGRAYFAIGVDTDLFKESKFLREVSY